MIFIKKIVVGVLYAGNKISKDEKFFLKLAKKKNIEIVLINILKRFNKEEFEKQIKKCDIIYNNSAEDFVLELLKTIEEFGKKIIDASNLYYYTEDKWMFYLKCKENNIPVPDTILLTNNLNIIRAELKEFGKWPVVLKRIYGTWGQFVEKANNIDEAIKIVKKFWKKDCDKIPIIAQEYIKSYSYRVTIINNKIVQTAIKKAQNWKCTGVHAKICEKFRVSKDLRNLLHKVMKIVKINICGVDLLKKGDQWLVLEVNAEPGLDFIDEEQEKLTSKILDFIKLYYKMHIKKKLPKVEIY